MWKGVSHHIMNIEPSIIMRKKGSAKMEMRIGFEVIMVTGSLELSLMLRT